jgi:hypothetical protein
MCQFLEHVAAQNAPDPWDYIAESVSITSLHASQDGSVNLLLDDHDELKPTTIIAVAKAVGSMSKDPCPRTLLQVALTRILDLKLICFVHAASNVPDGGFVLEAVSQIICMEFVWI